MAISSVPWFATTVEGPFGVGTGGIFATIVRVVQAFVCVWVTISVNINFVNDIWNKSYMNCRNEMKMKKWSSRWTQFMQLRKEDWSFRRSYEYMNLQLTCSQRQWLHSQLIEHRSGNGEVKGSNPVEVLIFLGFFTLLLKLRSLRRSFLRFQILTLFWTNR